MGFQIFSHDLYKKPHEITVVYDSEELTDSRTTLYDFMLEARYLRDKQIQKDVKEMGDVPKKGRNTP